MHVPKELLYGYIQLNNSFSYPENKQPQKNRGQTIFIFEATSAIKMEMFLALFPNVLFVVFPVLHAKSGDQ
jgi:hypothetical protein